MSDQHLQPSYSNLLRDREKHALRWWGGALFVNEPAAPESLWFDFLLDLALAASYSNLASNVHAMSNIETLSYVAFFLLLWWIWTSQVAYNARFRKNDWLHRVYLLLQLFQFGALATFTSNFIVSRKIIKDENTGERNDILTQAGFTPKGIKANATRRAHLLDLNDRGIARTMACSRLLLLLQYAIAWYRQGKTCQGRMQHSLLPITISLILSSTMYLTASTKLIDGGKSEAVAKVTLWYSAIIVEILGLYFDIMCKNGQNYPKGTTLFDRFSILMTVIVGDGLSQVTGTLHFLVGNIGFTENTALDITSAGLIIFAIFILYFEGWCWFMPPESSSAPALDSAQSRLKTNLRPLTWLILHVLYFCCLIPFMSSLKGVLALQNLAAAANYLHKDMRNMLDFVNNPNMDWDESRFNKSLNYLGLSWDSLKAHLDNESLSEVRTNISYWLAGHIYIHLASLFELHPVPDSLEWHKIQVFDRKNQTSEGDFLDIVKAIFTNPAESTLWLTGSAGGTLIALSILNIIQRSPPDKYAWLSVISRFLVGSVVASGTFLNINAEPYAVFGENQSLIWKFLKTGWLLPSLALVFIGQVVIDYALTYRAVFHSRTQTVGPIMDSTETPSIYLPPLPFLVSPTGTLTCQIFPEPQTPAGVHLPTIEMPSPQPAHS